MEILAATDEPAALSWADGSVPYDWARDVGAPSDGLAKRRLTRAEVSRDFPALTDEQRFLTIMAWGGQRRSSGALAWSKRSDWLPIVSALNEGTMDALTAYDRFSKLRSNGLGPAYFTKLIFFYTRGEEDGGFILDQWTGKSAELITDGETRLAWDSITAKLSKGRIRRWDAALSRSTGSETYAAFGRLVHELADEAGRDPHVVEAAMFGGKGEPWRRYVEAEWRCSGCGGSLHTCP